MNHPPDEPVVHLPGREPVTRLPRTAHDHLGGSLWLQPAGRQTDLAMNPADAHGCPACPHPVSGPAVQGSPNVFINGLPALRVGDPGIHAACCDGNTWKAAGGTARVLINGLPACRKGDPTQHCGGSGHLISGSPNVLFGGRPIAGKELDQAVFRSKR
ncbi:MAG: PAAR domain-containing protein [Bryobacteraceae bacterium]|nr:PAAR domain-containing protein [Bryobacteraceae bacterium]